MSVKANLGLPPDLDTLCHDFIEDHRVLRCPVRWQEDNGAIGYVWIPNRRKTEKDELARILAYDKFPHPFDPPTRNVLFTDLTVGTLTEEELQRRLAEELE